MKKKHYIRTEETPLQSDKQLNKLTDEEIEKKEMKKAIEHLKEATETLTPYKNSRVTPVGKYIRDNLEVIKTKLNNKKK